MKVAAKEFAIYNNERPKILLLGNGFNRINDNSSWNELLNSMRDEKFKFDASIYDIPNGLKASMLANGELKSKIEKYINKAKKENKLFKNDDQLSNQLYYDFASLNFDYILTTNYSYEIELAISGKNELSNNKIYHMMKQYRNNPDRKYFLHTFNQTNNNEFSRDIWHIHGEYRKPSSIILGQLYYGNLLSNYKNSLPKSYKSLEKNIINKEVTKIDNWIKAFIVGDVYIVGLGMDFAEVDLWWLLEEKFQNKNRGKTYFYNPKEQAFDYQNILKKNTNLVLDKYNINELHKIKDSKEYEKQITQAQCKKYLMEAYDVKYQDLNYIPDKDHSYLDFYKLVLKDIESKLKN